MEDRNESERLRGDVFSSFHELGKRHPQLQDAEMLVGGAEAAASLQKKIVRRSIDEDWVSQVENTMPYLDAVIRQPFRAIEDVEDVVPVELSKRVSEKSIRHLSQHTNFIRKIEGDVITPSKILNVYHEETLITYENKFTNTLIRRLFTFVDRRYRILGDHFATEQLYELTYGTKFEHEEAQVGTTNVDFQLKLNLSSPMTRDLTPGDERNNQVYQSQLQRVGRIYHTLLGYLNSDFCQKLGKNLIRPPVVRTNAILKNKNLKVCLDLWEYIQGFEKTGYTISEDQFRQVPSDQYIRDFYHPVALQYVQFYNGVMQDSAGSRLLSEKHISPVEPDFESSALEEEVPDYNVYDTEYRKMVPVSRLSGSRKKLSEDEKKIREAVDWAIEADEALEAECIRREAEERRRREEEIQRRREEELQRQRLREAEERRVLEEKMELARFQREQEERRLQEEARLERLRREAQQQRLQREAQQKRLEQEARERAAAEQERLRKEAEERRRVAEEIEALRLAQEQQRAMEAAAAEKRRQEEEAERRHYEELLLVAEAERLYYHSREEYLSLPRKKKKKILGDLRAMQDYEKAVEAEQRHPTGRRIPKPGISDWEELRRWERSVRKDL